MHDKAILAIRHTARALAGIPIVAPRPRRDSVCPGRYDPGALARPFKLISVEISAAQLPEGWRDG